MMRVLRLSEGDEVDVSDTVEWEYRGRIVSLTETEAQLEIIDKQSFSGEPDIDITLFQGIPKQGKMETIVQKCVELGVKEIVPVFMDRTVIVDRGNFGKKVQRWNKVSAEAVKQCRRGVIPEVCEPLKMKDVYPLFDDYDLVLFPYENEKGRTIKEELLEALSPIYIEITGNILEKIAVIIGPEGGFSEEEAREIVSRGGKSVSLGRRILRTETAGMAAIAMIMYEMEL